MTDKGNNSMVQRRSVLRTFGTTAGLSMIGIPVSARQTDSPVEFRGISYDSKTDIEQGLTHAELEFDENEIHGVLEISGLQIPIDERTELISESRFGQSWRFVLNETQFQKDGLPLKGGFRTDGKRLGGHLTRPSHQYHPLGFSMHDVNESAEVEDIRGIISDDGVHSLNKKEKADEIILPDTGVPKLDLNKKNTDRTQSKNEISSTDESPLAIASTDENRIIATGDETTYDFETYRPDSNCGYDDTVYDARHYNLTYSLFESPGLAPDPNTDDNSVEVQQGGNRVMYLHGVWTNDNQPENIVHEECFGSESPAQANSVEFTVKTIEDRLSPTNMLPDEDNGDSSISEWVDTSLDVVGAIPSPWTSIGTSVVRLLLPEEDTDYVNTNLDEPMGGGSGAYWEFDLGSETDNFPMERENAQSVRVTLSEGGRPTGSTHEVEINSEYSYTYPKHNQDCPCQWSWKTNTTTVSTSFEMEVVDLG